MDEATTHLTVAATVRLDQGTVSREAGTRRSGRWMKRARLFRRWMCVTGALGVTTVLLAGCVIDTEGNGADTPKPAPRDADAVVTIADLSFSPSTVEIGTGEAVAWVWDDGVVPHDVVFEAGPESPQQSGGTWEHRFDEPGTYDYRCTIHPQMTGRVVVT
jgi:plastocyanin